MYVYVNCARRAGSRSGRGLGADAAGYSSQRLCLQFVIPLFCCLVSLNAELFCCTVDYKFHTSSMQNVRTPQLFFVQSTKVNPLGHTFLF